MAALALALPLAWPRALGAAFRLTFGAASESSELDSSSVGPSGVLLRFLDASEAIEADRFGFGCPVPLPFGSDSSRLAIMTPQPAGSSPLSLASASRYCLMTARRRLLTLAVVR